ncbi:hypothetical protein BKA80DRAFT_290506 [Phyllosticta citrichinensis]
MSTNGLSQPGSSTYSSNSMYVGDGTWDSERNTFLLPNLMGLNFDTMRYNGMGNRFRELSGYKSLVTGHAIVAAITFLAVVPAAIFFARFYHRNPRLALRMHIWLQILTVLLTTVVFTLGWFAVGGARSLTNPHHGIGLAIYVLVLVQAIGGALIHRIEKGKERLKIPLKLMMHQWMGRAIALLGFVQVPLGLTLYGSPAYLFVLYALWGAFLLLLYFILTYRNLPVGAFDDDGTYISYATESTDEGRSRRSRSRLGALATAGAAGAGLAALRRRSKSRKREREAESAIDRENMRERQRSRSRDRRAAASGRSSSYLEEEKFYEEPPKQHTWRNRILTGAATIGAIAAAKNIFGKKKTPEESDVGSGYSYPSQGRHRVSQTDISRVEEGRVPASPMTPGDRYRRIQESEVAGGSAVTGSLPPRRPHARTRRSGGSIDSYDSRDSYDYVEETARPGAAGGGGEKSHKARNGLLALGLIGFIKHKMNQRRDRREEDRVARLREEEVEQERLARADSQRRKYTGDGFEPYTPTSPRSRRGSRRISSSHGVDDHLVHHGSNPELARQTYPPRPPPQHAGASTSTTGMMASRIDTVGEGSHPSTGFVPPPPGGAAPHDPLPLGRGAPLGPAAPINDSTSYSSSSLTSPTRDAASRRHGGRKRRSAAALAGTGAAIGAAALAARASRSHSRSGSRSRSRSGGRRRRQEQDDPLSSPPVSVKVKMHKDGRHVTLRRLNEQEAAEEREARRRERRGESAGGGGAAGKSSTGRSRRASTLSDVSGSEDRWRRRSAAMAGAAGGPGEMDIKARAAAIAKEIDIEHEAANVQPPPPPAGPPPPPHQQQQQAPPYMAPYPMPGPPPGPPPPPQQQQPYQYPQQGLQPPHTPFNNPNPKPFHDSSISPPQMPPPGMGSAMGVGSGMGSPYETGPSDMSANYDSNRRRRRMERAAQAARGRGSGSRVEFT